MKRQMLQLNNDLLNCLTLLCIFGQPQSLQLFLSSALLFALGVGRASPQHYIAVSLLINLQIIEMSIKQRYAGKPVLVTGTTGFLGKVLLEKQRKIEFVREIQEINHQQRLFRQTPRTAQGQVRLVHQKQSPSHPRRSVKIGARTLHQAKQQLKRLQNSTYSSSQHTVQVNTELLGQQIKQNPHQKQQLNIDEYTQLHEKLDSIQNKIAVIKQHISKTQQQPPNTTQQAQLQALVTQEPEQPNLHYPNHTIHSQQQQQQYYISELVRAYQDERSLAREHLNATLSIIRMIDTHKQPTDKEMKNRKVSLPLRAGYQGKKTVVFDLDETLIHCNYSASAPCDVRLPITTSTGQVIEAGINVRPYARQILRGLSEHFEVMVFTASHSSYARVVIDYLDGGNGWIHHRLFRQHCIVTAEGLYVKDLRVIDRDLKSVILVDNAAYSYAYQLSNAVPILPYYHGHADQELPKLEQYLLTLLQVGDVREQNEKTFKLTQYKDYLDKPQALVQQLYIPK